MLQVVQSKDANVWDIESCICGPDLHLYRDMVADTRVSTNFGAEFCGIAGDAGLKSRTPSPASMCQVTI